ncbi:hypothetical protein AMAG_20026 [Allomyces macrogynus ATCC 38327]|uniref:Uncharacterized protein n=1 Tax=Allomyces macrogynus (strain ATCC 38327) TaxID=578462 RepID=A0A0L0T4G7_ALLM3|nr:hypothetical protein AMAG_20026 [Allomyces macrogynus ATCC 38327]|eukprot:KNE69708.1 hypothetical protein AMAG_20026 [Allomyces macrogynus ATCC 38327]
MRAGPERSDDARCSSSTAVGGRHALVRVALASTTTSNACRVCTDTPKRWTDTMKGRDVTLGQPMISRRLPHARIIDATSGGGPGPVPIEMLMQNKINGADHFTRHPVGRTSKRPPAGRAAAKGDPHAARR